MNRQSEQKSNFPREETEPSSSMTKTGFTVWFTGLPCSGKSTLAEGLAAELRYRGHRVEVLDGDEVRKRLTKGLGFSKADRDENIRRISYVAHLLTRNGVVAIVAAISPYSAIRQEARLEIGAFVEVHVKCDLKVCIERDVKGLYQRAIRGEISEFTGISDPYEDPLAPEVLVETDKETPDQCINKLLSALDTLGYSNYHITPEGALQS